VLERVTPEILYRVKTSKPEVGLSFDDGPHPRFTPQVLEILAAQGAKATFFLIGERAQQEPELVARIRAAGHEIGNHYFESGPTLWHSNAEFERRLKETEMAIGSPERLQLFRPPGGVAWPRQLRLARALGYTCVLGCAYPHDPMRPPLRYMRWLIEKNLRPGTIVILHDGIGDATRSVEVLQQILEAGKKQGLTFVTIGSLLARRPG
jgi:peptidoglycan/xylan/chitin deacetylase (PgdA/CDA1 family)